MTVWRKDIAWKSSRIAVSAATSLLMFGMGEPSFADITNSAVAVGTNGADNTASSPAISNVPLVGLSPDLGISNTITTPPVSGAKKGDVITYHYVITNNGNQTLTNVIPVSELPTFNGDIGTGSLGEFTLSAGNDKALSPGASVAFTASYTLTLLDIYRAAGVNDGVSNSAKASSAEHVDNDSSTALTTIVALPSLIIDKTALLNDEIVADSLAQLDETITYSFTVTNNGNVALKNVGIQDTHSGVLLDPPPADETIVTEGPLQLSDIGVADNGIIDQLEAGAVARFTYVHTVTQAEVDAQ